MLYVKVCEKVNVFSLDLKVDKVSSGTVLSSEFQTAGAAEGALGVVWSLRTAQTALESLMTESVNVSGCGG